MKRSAARLLLLLGTALACGGAAAQQDSTAKATQALLANGHADQAMSVLETQVGTNPFDAVSMNNLAAVKASRQDWYGASELLVRAHRLAPDNPVISDNLKQLNQWLAQRSSVGAAPAAAAGDAALPPEPPPLWQAPAPSSGTGAQRK